MHNRIEKPLKESIKCESSSPAGSFILVESIRETVEDILVSSIIVSSI